MIASYKKSANKWLVGGLLLQVAAFLLESQGVQVAQMFVGLLNIAGIAAFIYGCMLYAQAKGQNQWYGLLGLLSLLGLLILVFLPDKNKK